MCIRDRVKALDNCEFNPVQYPGAHVGRSVTEWEVSQILQKTEYLCRSLWVQRDWDNEGAELTAEELKLFEKFYSVGKNEVATREKLEALISQSVSQSVSKSVNK